MNKGYKIIYNNNTGNWVAVSELSPKRGKTSRAHAPSAL